MTTPRTLVFDMTVPLIIVTMALISGYPRVTTDTFSVSLKPLLTSIYCCQDKFLLLLLTSTLFQEENEDDPGSDSENLDLSCPVDSGSFDAGYQYRCKFIISLLQILSLYFWRLSSNCYSNSLEMFQIRFIIITKYLLLRFYKYTVVQTELCIFILLIIKYLE